MIHGFLQNRVFYGTVKSVNIDPVGMFSSDRLSKVGLYSGGGSGGRDIHHAGKTVAFKNKQKKFCRF